MFYIMIAVVVIQQYTFVKTHRIAALKLVNFIARKLHLNKANQFLNSKKNFFCKNFDSAIPCTNWSDKISCKAQGLSPSIHLCFRHNRTSWSYNNSSVFCNEIKTYHI